MITKLYGVGKNEKGMIFNLDIGSKITKYREISGFEGEICKIFAFDANLFVVSRTLKNNPNNNNLNIKINNNKNSE